MKTRGWRLAESYKWVKDKREKVNIKAGELEEGLHIDYLTFCKCIFQGNTSCAKSTCKFLEMEILS